MKTHLELYGWSLERSKHNRGWFLLRLRGFVGYYACGSLDFVVGVMRRELDC